MCFFLVLFASGLPYAKKGLPYAKKRPLDKGLFGQSLSTSATSRPSVIVAQTCLPMHSRSEVYSPSSSLGVIHSRSDPDRFHISLSFSSCFSPGFQLVPLSTSPEAQPLKTHPTPPSPTQPPLPPKESNPPPQQKRKEETNNPTPFPPPQKEKRERRKHTNQQKQPNPKMKETNHPKATERLLAHRVGPEDAAPPGAVPRIHGLPRGPSRGRRRHAPRTRTWSPFCFWNRTSLPPPKKKQNEKTKKK